MVTTETELNKLEQEIDRIIKSHQQLVLQNKSLQKKITDLTKELAILQTKKTKTTQMLKTLLTQLKDQLICQQK